MDFEPSFKPSGIGTEGGLEGLLEFTVPQTRTMRKTVAEQACHEH